MQKTSFASIQARTSFLPTKYLGYFYALLANFAMCISGFIIKKSQSTLSSNQVQFFLGIQLAVYSYMFCRQQNISVVPKSTVTAKLLLKRGVLGFLSTLAYVLALKYLPLSEAIVIFNTLPVFASLFAIIYLNEKYDTGLGINTGLSLLGVILISKPSFLFAQEQGDKTYEFRQFGLFCVLFATISGAVITIFLKKLGGSINPAVTVFHLGVINTLISPILMINDQKVALDFKSIIALLLIGLSWTISQGLQGLSYKFGDTTKIVVVMYSQVVFSFMFEILIDGNIPDGLSILGASSIISGFFVMFFKASNHNQPSSHRPSISLLSKV